MKWPKLLFSRFCQTVCVWRDEKIHFVILGIMLDQMQYLTFKYSKTF